MLSLEPEIETILKFFCAVYVHVWLTFQALDVWMAMNVFFVFSAMLEFAIVNTVLRRAVRSRVKRQLASTPQENSVKRVKSHTCYYLLACVGDHFICSKNLQLALFV